MSTEETLPSSSTTTTTTATTATATKSHEKKSSTLFCAITSKAESNGLKDEEIQHQLNSFLDMLGQRDDVFLLPPDYTRLHSQAGKITSMITDYYKLTNQSKKNKNLNDNEPGKKEEQQDCPKIQIMPALGTHTPMTKEQIHNMFGEKLANVVPSPFLVHDWRNDVETIGYVPDQMVSDATRGMVKKPWPAQLNKAVWAKRNKPRSLILSIGQVVPHEVMGMANFNKNMFVGIGGLEAINLSHFIGAVYGMENMMGRANNPLRSILNYASEQFLGELDLWYVLTVIGSNPKTGETEMKGLFIGNDIQCYQKACELSLKVNFTMLEKSPSKMVVYLDGDEFHSTWLGNKAIYRTRMAIADNGELVIIAPGIKRFGEDDRVDELIRKYGYIGTPRIMEAMEKNVELQENLGTVAHLIHGSSEGRFSITYCPGHLSREEIETVGFNYGLLDDMTSKYDVSTMTDGWYNDKETDESFYFIKNPALGLWAVPERFDQQSS